MDVSKYHYQQQFTVMDKCNNIGNGQVEVTPPPSCTDGNIGRYVKVGVVKYQISFLRMQISIFRHPAHVHND